MSSSKQKETLMRLGVLTAFGLAGCMLMYSRGMSSTALLDGAPESPSTCSTKNFRAWLEENGAVSKDLTSAVFDINGNKVRGMQTLQEIRPGENVIALPEQVIFTPKNPVLLNSPVQALLKAMPRNDDFTVLSMHVLFELQKGPSSYFWQFVCSLPDQASFKANFPLFWDDDRLSKSDIEQQKWVHTSQFNLRKRWLEIEPILGKFPDVVRDRTLFSFPAFKWAMSLVLSRNFWMSNHNVMTPFADLLNHRQGVSRAVFETRPYKGGTKNVRWFVLKANILYKPGDQVFDDYACNTCNVGEDFPLCKHSANLMYGFDMPGLQTGGGCGTPWSFT